MGHGCARDLQLKTNTLSAENFRRLRLKSQDLHGMSRDLDLDLKKVLTLAVKLPTILSTATNTVCSS